MTHTTRQLARSLAEQWEQTAPKYARRPHDDTAQELVPHTSTSIDAWRNMTRALARDIDGK